MFDKQKEDNYYKSMMLVSAISRRKLPYKRIKINISKDGYIRFMWYFDICGYLYQSGAVMVTKPFIIDHNIFPGWLERSILKIKKNIKSTITDTLKNPNKYPFIKKESKYFNKWLEELK